MNAEQQAKLISAALQVRKRAFAPYSHFCVGAALLTSDGQIVVGCNVENQSYGLTICAERVAVGSAVAIGQREYEALAVAAPGGAAPCGACRQVLSQFCDDLPILLVDADQPQRVVPTRLAELFPRPFAR